MEKQDSRIRHLLDLYRRSGRQSVYQYSGFLSPAEQENLRRALAEEDPKAREGTDWSLEGGAELTERRILVCGSEALLGYPPEPPFCAVRIRPAADKFAEELTHRDYLGSLLSLGIERSLLGDIRVRDKNAWLICLESIAPYIQENLTRVRRTSVICEIVNGEIPELRPQFREMKLNVASERADAVAAAFAGLSRSQTERLFAAEKVQIGGRIVTDGSRRLKEGDVLSVRGCGKAVYDGITRESRKGRLFVILRKLI